MKKTSIKVMSLLAVLVASVSAFAEDELRPVAPLIDESTLMVMHARLDEKAIQVVIDKAKAFQDAMNKSHPTTQPASPASIIRDWYDSFNKAGGKEIYFVTSPITGNLTAIPLTSRFDIKAMLKVFNAQDDSRPLPDTSDQKELTMRQFQPVGKRVGNLLVIGPRRSLATVDDIAPADRHDLAKAFAALGDAPAKMVFSPSEIVKKAMPATMSADLGGYSTEPFKDGLRWLAVGIKIDPAISANMVVQAADAKSGQAMLDTFSKAMASYKETAQDRDPSSDAASGGGLFITVADMISPKIKGDQIVAQADPDKLKKLEPSIISGLVAARMSGLRMRAVASARNICTALATYAASHNDEFPSDLQTLIKTHDLTENAMKNPHLPDRTPGFAYVKPSAPSGKLKDAAATVVIYENYETWDDNGIAVGFADGHAKLIKSESEFKTLLAGGQTKPRK